MKKTLLFVLLASCAVFAQSQTFTVSYNNDAVANGDTLTLKAPANNEIQFNPIFRNNGAFNLICRIQGEKLNNTTTEIVSICTVVCKDGYLSVPFQFNGNSTYSDTQIDFDVPENAEPGLFKITIFDTAYPSTNAFFFVKVYNKNSTAIESADDAHSICAYPNPTSGTVTVEHNGGELVIYNMSGVAVREVVLGESAGTTQIDVSALPCGVYMYGLKGNRTMKKLVVR